MRIAIAGASLILFLLVGAIAGVWINSCLSNIGKRDPLTEKIESVEEDLPPEDPGPVRRITHRANPVLRAGVDTTAVAKLKAEKFAKSARDSTLPAELPEVKGTYNKGRLTLAVGDSRGRLHRSETKCSEPCDFGTRSNELFSESQRHLFRNNWKDSLVRCGLASGAGAIIGQAGWKRPVEGAAAAGTVCIGLEVAF